MQHLLTTFEVEGRQYSVYGNYTIKLTHYRNTENYLYPEFHSLTAKQVVDGGELDYSPSGTNWVGHKYTECDMIQSLLAALIRKDDSYACIYLNGDLQELVNSYTDDGIVVNGSIIPKKILGYDMYDLYSLELVTQQYIYYSCDDSWLMLSTDNHNVISDNYFAEVGYTDSVEDILAGKESLLWGEIPKECV